MDSRTPPEQLATAGQNQPAPAFTPGPWQVAPMNGRSVVAEIGVFKMGSLGADVLARDMEANARLIAAAPDLYAALKAALLWVAICEAHFGEYTHPEAVANHKADLALIQAAIFKAEGR